ncbi:MAG: phosphodiester glycosidase family protein [Clostridia bacterium]|nr:phosphodiester glycosidase family protein [Clostridia bacterium]
MKRLLLLTAALCLLACSFTPAQPPTPQESARPEEPTAAPVISVQADTIALITPAPEPTPTGLCGGRFPDKFTETPVLTENSYSDDGLSITITRYEDNLTLFRQVAVYFVADVYVQDIVRWKTAAAKNDFTSRATDKLINMAEANDALFAVSGDYFNYQVSNGVIIRNGELYRQQYDRRRDLCVLYRDGVMKTFEVGTYTVEEILESDPWQTWQFGPALLDENGEVKEHFNSSLLGPNPRCAIGYYEPGHYCFVIVDGRNEEYSMGASLSELSLLMKQLGCKAAYNLDGGLSAQIYFNGEIQNRTYGVRPIGDILYFNAQ